MKAAIVTILVAVVVACSGATDPNPTPATDGGTTTGTSSSSSSSGEVKTVKDAGVPATTAGTVACGTTKCTLPSVCCKTGDTAECKPSADECTDEVISCDEEPDCAVGHCCAEESSKNQFRWSTYCRPSCVTGVPRVAVCTFAVECGACKDWSCGGFDMKGLKTCAPLGPCD